MKSLSFATILLGMLLALTDKLMGTDILSTLLQAVSQLF